MITGEAIAISAENLTELAKEIGTIGSWLQAIGVVAIIWLLFQILNSFINKKRIDKLNSIQKKLHQIEEKLDKVIKKKR